MSRALLNSRRFHYLDLLMMQRSHPHPVAHSFQPPDSSRPSSIPGQPQLAACFDATICSFSLCVLLACSTSSPRLVPCAQVDSLPQTPRPPPAVQCQRPRKCGGALRSGNLRSDSLPKRSVVSGTSLLFQLLSLLAYLLCKSLKVPRRLWVPLYFKHMHWALC